MIIVRGQTGRVCIDLDENKKQKSKWMLSRFNYNVLCNIFLCVMFLGQKDRSIQYVQLQLAYSVNFKKIIKWNLMVGYHF